MISSTKNESLFYQAFKLTAVINGTFVLIALLSQNPEFLDLVFSLFFFAVLYVFSLAICAFIKRGK